MKIDFILNDLIENSFNEEYIEKRLNNKDALRFIEQGIYNKDEIVKMAKERYIDRLAHEQYIFSLS